MIVLHTIGSHGPTYYNRIRRSSGNLPQPATLTRSRPVQRATGEHLRQHAGLRRLYCYKAINLLKEHQDKFTTSLVYFLTTVNR